MMSNSSVAATPSQDELREIENIKNVKNSEERETDNLNSNIDIDPLPTVSSSASSEAGGSPTRQSKLTKIPAPVVLGASGSQVSTRKYTSVLDLTKTLQLSTNDSGINMDSSMSEVEPIVQSDLPKPNASFQSEMELQLAEQQTLKELQRVVAEMEAQLALDDEEEKVEAETETENKGQLDASKAQQKPLANDPGQGSAKEQTTKDVQVNEETTGQIEGLLVASEAQQEPLANDPGHGSAQEQTTNDLHINEEKTGPKEDVLVASEAQQKPMANDPGQGSAQEQATNDVHINEENTGPKEDLLVASEAQQKPMANDPGQGSAQEQATKDVHINEEKAGPKEDLLVASKAQQEPMTDKAEQDSAQKPASDNVQDKENSGQMQDPLVTSEAQQEPLPNEPAQEFAQKPASDEVQIKEDTSGQKEEPLAGQGTINNEGLQGNQEMLEKSTQKEEPEPVKERMEPLPTDSDPKFQQLVVPEPSVGSVEVHIQQAFENTNQFQEQVPLEEGPETEYERFLREHFEMLEESSQDLLGEPEPVEVAEADLPTTSEVAQPSQASSHLDGNRRMFRVEELFGNANNIDLLRRLLQIGAEGSIIDSEPDFGTQESSDDNKDTDESQSGPGTSSGNGTVTGTEASTEEDPELIDDDDDSSSEGLEKATFSLVRLFSGKLVSLACPFIFCGLAAGLIYLSRKAYP